MKIQAVYPYIVSLFFLICLGTASHAQVRLSPQSFQTMMDWESQIQETSAQILHGKTGDIRQSKNEQFIPTLVQILKTPYSFYYPFDSLINISKQYPKDSSFRILTWALEFDNGTHRHFGTIQMNTKDGQLKMFPLFDNSDFIQNTDTITNHQAWYGCLYYNIEQKRYFNQNYYTLFGYDGHNFLSQKKIMEVLTFNKAGEPVFGGPFFSFVEDTLKRPTQNRFIIEYKKGTAATLNYNPEMELVVYDHLIPENDEVDKKYTYVSDLDYEGFKWQAGKWVHVEKIFNDALQLGNVPVGQPLNKKKVDFTKPRETDEVLAEEPKNKRSKKSKPTKLPF